MSKIELFDGSNHIYPAKIIEASKKAVKVEILGCELSDKESNLSIHLGQVISRGDRMEFTSPKICGIGRERDYTIVVRTLWREG